jgi:L-threonylcarbamoyladenylate synthase
MNKDIRKSFEALEKGQTFLYPTDTVWGIGCDATSFEAVSKIYQIKQRDESKSLVILVNTLEMLQNIIPNIPVKALEIIQNAEKPTTIIYDNPIGLAKNVVAEDKTVAIRLVKDEFCIALLQQFGKPIVSTSANISGEPTPSYFKEISDSVKKAVDYVVKWCQKDTEPKSASSIIKITKDNSVTIIRP